MAEMSNEELAAKIKEIKAQLEALNNQKIQIGVKRDQLNQKVEELKPQIEAAFGTVDTAELQKKKAEFLTELSAIEL